MPPTNPPTDLVALVALGLAAPARRAWLAPAQAAPIPPPPAPRGQHVSVAALDEAIAAALARGHSSREEARMAKVHIKLVPEPSRERRVPCAVCGLSLAQALAGHDVCAHCAAAPEASRARLADRRAGHVAALARANEEAETALRALDAGDARRWDQIGAWRLAASRTGRWGGTGGDAQARLDKIKDAILDDPAQAVAALNEADARRWATVVERRALAGVEDAAAAWLARVEAAVADPASSQVSNALRRAWRAAEVSDALRRAWTADEVAFWARGGATEEIRRADVAAATFAACLDALSEAGVAVVVSAKTPGAAYQVATDGSRCSCPGFTFHGHCRHADERRGGRAA